jgi:2'-5' RNA ligase
VSPLPEQMEDRWALRVDPVPGDGVLYWHALLRDYPEVQELAGLARERLSGFNGLHFTPPEWLHMTTLLLGPRDKFSDEQIADMTDRARESLARLAPVRIELGRVLYHPQAIVLGIGPREALAPVQAAVWAACGLERSADEPVWVPHTTVAYSTARQPAAPLVSALGTELPHRTALLRSVSLVAQWGPEREWQWEPFTTIPLGG